LLRPVLTSIVILVGLALDIEGLGQGTGSYQRTSGQILFQQYSLLVKVVAVGRFSVLIPNY
jgi:hypothetical protein